jgi:quercetin dioxygenase-like cupin family protein
MFKKDSGQGYRELLEGVQLQTLVYGEKTLMGRFRLKKGSKVPLHKHPYEQTGIMVSGKLEFMVGGESFTAEPGDSWCIPENVEHGADALENSLLVEIFSPVRKDYLPPDEPD